MQEINDYIPITQAKAELLDLVRQLQETGDTLAITKNGLPEAVILSMDKYQGLLETISVLADNEMMAQIDSSSADMEEIKLFNIDGDAS